MRKVQVGLLIGSAAVLSVMGLVFCWAAPANEYLHGEGSHYFFTHMLGWTVIGLSLAICAYLIGWRRWLKAAPFIVFGWVGLVAYSATCPLVNGHWGWINLGCFRINVLEFTPVVVSLAAAYIARALKCRSLVAVSMILVAYVGAVGYTTVSKMNRVEYANLLPTQQYLAKNAQQPARLFLANQCVGSVRESEFFGGSDRVNLRFLPESMTTSMPAAASVLFGKWYLIALSIVLALMGIGIGVSWKINANSAMRAYTFLWGILVLTTSFLNIQGCVGFAPIVDVGVPFACFGGSLAISTLLGLAILLSQNQECGEGHALVGLDWAQITVPVIVLTLATVYGILSVQSRDSFTYRGLREGEKVDWKSVEL